MRDAKPNKCLWDIHLPKTMRVASLYCWVFKRETLKISVVLMECTSQGTVV